MLGPLLFLIYINDLHYAIIHSTVYHFADDTSLLNVSKSMKKINRHVNHDLKHLCIWLRANKISLNATKTTLINFRSKSKKITKKINFRISGQKLLPSKSIKYLGIHLDEHLSWSEHINYLLPKISRNTGMLTKIRHFVDNKTLLNIYYALFNSYITYGCQIWAQNKNPLLKRIFSLQNKALRIINFKSYRTPANALYANSKIIKLEDYVSILNYLFAHNYFIRNLPKSFNDFYTLVKSTHHYNTRSAHNNKLKIPASLFYIF